MEVARGEVWLADLPRPVGSGPGYRRPVLVVQSNTALDVGLNTVIVIAITTNIGWADLPGNVFLPARTGGLPQDSVANVTQLLTIDLKLLVDHLGSLPNRLLLQIDDGLRSILAISGPPGTLQ